MKFVLFSLTTFEVSDPVALIESYCFQSDFYGKYDLLLLGPDRRKVDHVNKIGARISRELLQSIKLIIEETKDLRIFRYDLDRFLEVDDATRSDHINELSEKVIKKLLGIKGIGLSRATKVLHTLYPETIPMIDDALQDEYRSTINSRWTEKQPEQIIIAYYNNLKYGNNWQNLAEIFSQTRSSGILGLTKVRIFDILWWSYLKAKRLRQEKNIHWSTIK
jgi:hypothetical protein